jgi:pre-mRNA-processing factor SLU7
LKLLDAEEPVRQEEKKLATWGTDIPQDLVLDQKLLQESLKKVSISYPTFALPCLFVVTCAEARFPFLQEATRKKEEMDERKRKYNVKWNDQVTAEDMEAYRMTRVRHDDPMRDFLN